MCAQFRPNRKRLARHRATGGVSARPQFIPDDETKGPVRLQKVLAARGLGSRRKCEELILTGRVEVDGQTVTELGARVEARQQIRVDGEPLKPVQHVYYLLNKPEGVLSTNRDPSGRMRTIDLVPQQHRLFSVGRLDMHSEGLMLLTNDGDLAHRLTHPRYGVDKTYMVQVVGRISLDFLTKLYRGIHLAEGVVRVRHAEIESRHKGSTVLKIVLAEGRNREIRRMLAKLGHRVQRLTRVAIGPLRLGKVPPGAHRPLAPDEVRELREVAYRPQQEWRDRPPGRAPGRAPNRPTRPRADRFAGGEAAEGEPRRPRRPRPPLERPRGRPRPFDGPRREQPEAAPTSDDVQPGHPVPKTSPGDGPGDRAGKRPGKRGQRFGNFGERLSKRGVKRDQHSRKGKKPFRPRPKGKRP
jgi:23S rRNA pseudouridine2605 synthase